MSRRIVRDDIRGETYYVKDGIEVCPDCEQQECECKPDIYCHRCGGDIVYNGNYFCRSYYADWCGWAFDWQNQTPFSEQQLNDALEYGRIEKVDW